MELKLDECTAALSLSNLLIEPFGIETEQVLTDILSDIILLIEPFGIETSQIQALVPTWCNLLIEPFGIETESSANHYECL